MNAIIAVTLVFYNVHTEDFSSLNRIYAVTEWNPNQKQLVSGRENAGAHLVSLTPETIK